jgi:hypothetical protein
MNDALSGNSVVDEVQERGWHLTVAPNGEIAAWGPGVCSGPFWTREEALEWLVDKFAEAHRDAIDFIAADPELWERFDGRR